MQNYTSGEIDQQTKSAYEIQQFITQSALYSQNNQQNQSVSRNLNSITTNLDMINEDLHLTTYRNEQYYQQQNLNQNSRETAPYMKHKKIIKTLRKRPKTLYKNTIGHKKPFIKNKNNRILKYVLPSLINLSGSLQFQEQVDNLKKDSLKSIFLPFQKMIALPYKQKNQNDKKNQMKVKKNNYFLKQDSKLLIQKQNQIIRNKLTKSLEKLVMQIQKPYTFFLNQQKNSFNQKQQKAHFLEDQFYDKKDCEQIKTIVDYTQGQQYDHQKPIQDYQLSLGLKKKSFFIHNVKEQSSDIQNYSHQNNQMKTN